MLLKASALKIYFRADSWLINSYPKGLQIVPQKSRQKSAGIKLYRLLFFVKVAAAERTMV
jgi:hypothetical protein